MGIYLLIKYKYYRVLYTDRKRLIVSLNMSATVVMNFLQKIEFPQQYAYFQKAWIPIVDTFEVKQLVEPLSPLITLW